MIELGAKDLMVGSYVEFRPNEESQIDVYKVVGIEEDFLRLIRLDDGFTTCCFLKIRCPTPLPVTPYWLQQLHFKEDIDECRNGLGDKSTLPDLAPRTSNRRIDEYDEWGKREVISYWDWREDESISIALLANGEAWIRNTDWTCSYVLKGIHHLQRMIYDMEGFCLQLNESVPI